MARHRSDTRTFARWLDTAIMVRNWKQKDVALATGVNEVQVMRWRRGIALPGRHYVTKLAEAFGVDREVLEHMAGVDEGRASESGQSSALPELDILTYSEGVQLHEALAGIPPSFWPLVLEAQATGRRLAIETIRAARELADRNSQQRRSLYQRPPLFSDESFTSAVA